MADVLHHAASIGAQYVFLDVSSAGVGRKTVRVPIARTTGRTITSTGSTYGSANYNSYSNFGSYNGYSGYGSSRGTVNSQTNSYNSTYVPGNTVYGFQEVPFDKVKVYARFYTPIDSLSEEGASLVVEYKKREENLQRLQN